MEIRGALLRKRQVLILFVLLGLSQARPESVPYSVAEDTEIGSLVANLARDLGLGRTGMQEATGQLVGVPACTPVLGAVLGVFLALQKQSVC